MRDRFRSLKDRAWVDCGSVVEIWRCRSFCLWISAKVKMGLKMSIFDKDQGLRKMTIKETTKQPCKSEVVLDTQDSQKMGCIDIHSKLLLTVM